MLAAAALVARREHQGAARDEKRGKQRLHICNPGCSNGGIVCLSFKTIVPGMVVIVAVAIALAVFFIVLMFVADEIVQGETVMGSEKIDAAGVLAAMAGKDRRGTGKRIGQRPGRAGVPAPEPAHVIAGAIVPFEEAFRKIAELVTAGADIPRFGD